MGKPIVAGFALIAAMLLSVSNPVQASPFTYQFVLPDWSTSFSPSSFGSHGILDVTVNNGSSSDLSQTYLNSQIEQLSLTDVGGTFADTWTSANVSSATPNVGYISTNAAGVPILDLLASDAFGMMGTAYFVVNATGELQLGVTGTTGGDTPLFADDVATESGAWYSAGGNGQYYGFEVLGTQVPTSVPEPVSIALFGLGLAAMTAMGKLSRN
jgi:hypothetical protein